jgi:geranylgeranyl diphosphate synthase type II
MFDEYVNFFEKELIASIERMGDKSALRDACEYALLSGGKRLRPLFVLMIGKCLGKTHADLIEAALAVEYFHTASLIADDLPCMDDDDQRRNRPTLHKVYHESIALLASYTLIALGYEGIYRSGQIAHSNEATIKALKLASKCAGIQGATHGQFIDLFPPDHSIETFEKTILQKTATLFQLSFAFGWLFGGGDPAVLPKVEQAALHLGIAFQISDDLQDLGSDRNETFCSLLGFEAGVDRFEAEMHSYETLMQELGIWNDEFAEVSRKLRAASNSQRPSHLIKRF